MRGKKSERRKCHMHTYVYADQIDLLKARGENMSEVVGRLLDNYLSLNTAITEIDRRLEALETERSVLLMKREEVAQRQVEETLKPDPLRDRIDYYRASMKDKKWVFENRERWLDDTARQLGIPVEEFLKLTGKGGKK